MNKTALITGISGQDGSYLAELLLEKGYDVYGTIRRNSIASQETTRINHILSDINVDYVDVTDALSVENIVKSVKPDETYHLASMSQVGISFTQPIFTMQSVAMSSLNVLNALKQYKPDGKYYQACSSEIYGNDTDKTIMDEHSEKNPVSPYGIAKLAAYHLTRMYRNSHGMFASNGILFNHESPRRGETFVTQKVVTGAYNISQGKQDKLCLGNINSRRDWGHAKDYVKAMWLMLQHDIPDDYVCATGVSHSIRDLCRIAFSAFGLDYTDYVIADDPKYNRPEDLFYLCGDSTKLRTELNWKPAYNFNTLINDMIAGVRE